MKHALDVTSAYVVAFTLVGWLPSIAALFSIIWCIIQISESAQWARLVRAIKSWR